MQTFLVGDFKYTAKVLDYQRLASSRLEGWIVLRTNLGLSIGWKNHPITIAWENHEWALCEYLLHLCREWRIRNYKDYLSFKILDIQKRIKHNNFVYPKWINDERLINSHKSALLFKNYNYYSKFGWNLPAKIDYFWPENA